MPDSLAIAVIAGTFLFAGAVKGVIGLGLPTVSLGLLTAALDLRTAMALLIASWPLGLALGLFLITPLAAAMSWSAW